MSKEKDTKNNNNDDHDEDDELNRDHRPSNTSPSATNPESESFANVGTVKTKGSGKPIIDINSTESALKFRKAPKSRGIKEEIQLQKAELAQKVLLNSESSHHHHEGSNGGGEKNFHSHAATSSTSSSVSPPRRSNIIGSDFSSSSVVSGQTRNQLTRVSPETNNSNDNVSNSNFNSSTPVQVIPSPEAKLIVPFPVATLMMKKKQNDEEGERQSDHVDDEQVIHHQSKTAMSMSKIGEKAALSSSGHSELDF